MLFNFLANAVKFTPAQGTVSVEAGLIERADGEEPTHVRISVKDTGPGIPSDDQERIFEKFVQLDPGVTREHGGTGLGLTISQELAQLLQGEIELDSIPGKGATFSLVLPIEMVEQSSPLMPEVSTSSNPRAPR